ncbi:hypothetical protein SLE2022_067950 [Rubroshorea leprosula]
MLLAAVFLVIQESSTVAEVVVYRIWTFCSGIRWRGPCPLSALRHFGFVWTLDAEAVKLVSFSIAFQWLACGWVDVSICANNDCLWV